MRITQGYLDQVAEEIRKLTHRAMLSERQGYPLEAARLRLEAVARREKLDRLRSARTDDVRFG